MVKDEQIVIEPGDITGCGTPEIFWCYGHIPRVVFVAALEAAEDITGYAVKVPEHAVVRQAWQSERLLDDEELILSDRRDHQHPNAYPMTFVFGDELDEL